MIRRYLDEGRLTEFIGRTKPLEAGFDLLPDHVIVTDADANILYANAAAERQTGFSRAEMIGKNPADLWGGQMPPEFYKKMWQTIKVDRKPFVGQVLNKRKDGISYWQEIHISPVLAQDGYVEFFIAIEPNITEKKREEEFRLSFVSVLGHQLRAPVSAINWTLEYLSSRGSLNEDEHKMLSEAYEQGEGLGRLIGDLLSSARVGNLFEHTERFNIVSEIHAVVSRVKLEFPSVTCTLKTSKGKFMIHGNKEIVMQVFDNLIQNAAKYSEHDTGKGVVKISIYGTENFFVEIENDGLLIPQEDQSKLFLRLFRASNAVASGRPGTGLGLYITKLICDGMGWEVSFKSPTDNGRTLFVVSGAISHQD